MLDLKVIGCEEWCVFVNLGIPAIKARVDSGAKTSSIQATNAKVIGRGGQEFVTFEVNPLQDNRSINIECEAKLVDRRIVKSSSGISEERFVIKTPVTIGEDTFDIELTYGI
jgi:ribosomal protein S6--L-glutamate ligase